ncbi:MAG: 30S ribosomal protein S8 [Nanoarchaeota archaeon]
MLNDPLSNMMSKILNAERAGKKEVMVKPYSKLIKAVLEVLNENLYVGSYEEIKDGKGNALKLSLLGRINKCGAIKPRFSVKRQDFEKFEQRHLPAKNLGVLIVSTPKGILTHTKAKELGLGGRLIAYCY